MANPVCEVLLTNSPLVAPSEAIADEMGAIVDFWGVVRARENGAKISGIEYEAHRAMAEHQLLAVAQEAADQFGLIFISIRHRLGFVPVAEPSLLLRVGSSHRAEAFRAAHWAVDELKKRVPIWKHPKPQGAREGAFSVPAASSCQPE